MGLNEQGANVIEVSLSLARHSNKYKSGEVAINLNLK
jgi:hypothetical protein